MLNALDDVLLSATLSRVLAQGYNLDTVTPVSVPEAEPEIVETPVILQTVALYLTWSGQAESTMLKVDLAYLITDADGYDPSSVTIKWYEFNEAGQYTHPHRLVLVVPTL